MKGRRKIVELLLASTGSCHGRFISSVVLGTTVAHIFFFLEPSLQSRSRKYLLAMPAPTIARDPQSTSLSQTSGPSASISPHKNNLSLAPSIFSEDAHDGGELTTFPPYLPWVIPNWIYCLRNLLCLLPFNLPQCQQVMTVTINVYKN